MVRTKISVDAALGAIRASVAPLAAERQPVSSELLHHVADRPVLALQDSPRFDCSAMDGFAVHSSDTEHASALTPAVLELGEEIAAQGPLACLRRGSALPISTGGPIPDGADTVVVLERGEIADGTLLLREPTKAGRNIRRRGEDAPRGTLIIEPGTLISPEAIGALPCYGVSHVWCRRPPRITVVPTGTEVLRDGDIEGSSRFDSNGPMIGALARQMGLQPRVLAPVPDDLEDIVAAFSTSGQDARADIIVSTGGVAGGNHDLVRQALDALSARIIFHGVAMRPGKPILFALLPDGRPFFGLPGNPVAALVGFRIFVTAAIRRQTGLPPEAGLAVEAPVEGRKDLTLFLSARHTQGGLFDTVPLDEQRSHIMRSPLIADCWLRVDQTESGSVATLYRKQPSLFSPRSFSLRT